MSGFQGSNPIILKLSPDCEAIAQEARALKVFEGFGAVSLLDQQNHALLLQQAVPGIPLKNYPKSLEIACKVIEKLRKAPLPQSNQFPHIETWLTTLDKEWKIPFKYLEKARKLKRKLLLENSASPLLLHGDLHQENILKQGDDWVVIDPKGVIGYPINEIWVCVEDPENDLQYLAQYFGYAFQDVVEWYYVHLILAACWQVEDNLDPSSFLTQAESVIPMMKL